MSTLTAESEELSAKISKLSEEMAALSDDIAAIDKAVAEASAQLFFFFRAHSLELNL